MRYQATLVLNEASALLESRETKTIILFSSLYCYILITSFISLREFENISLFQALLL